VRFLLEHHDATTSGEAAKHGDMVILNSSGIGRAVLFVEKLAKWLHYAASTWPDAAFVAKLQDDVYLCPYVWPFVWVSCSERLHLGWGYGLGEHGALFSKSHAVSIPSRQNRMDEMFAVFRTKLVQ